MTKTLIAILVAGVLHGQPASSQNGDKARGILLAGLGDKSADVRVQALQTLGMVGQNEDMIKGLVDHLDDKDFKVRIAVITAIVDLREKSAIGALQKRLIIDEVPEVSFAAAKALYILADPQGKIALEAIFAREMKAGSNMVRSKLRDLMRTMKTPKSAMLFALRNGVGYIPVPGLGEGVGATIDLLIDAELSARANVLLLMVTDKSEESKSMIASALTDQDWSVRAVGIQTIAMLNWLEFQAKLVELLDDKKEKVRFRAAAAYLRLAAIAEKKE